MTAPVKSTVKARAYWRWFVGFLVSLLALIIWIDSNGVSPPQEQNPECDHGQRKSLALPGPITSVSEYHDCQKLINNDGLTYGSLAGVFARNGLRDVVFSTDSGPALTPDSASGGLVVPGGSPHISISVLSAIQAGLRAKAVAIGEVMIYDKRYPFLGLEAGLNCLYVVRVQPPTGGPHQYLALMISNVTDDTACLDHPPATGGKWLPVSYTPPPETEPGYPPVARWDWDSEHKLQGISILCAPDWCDVRSPGMTATAAHDVNRGSPARDAPWEQKGRYDEQPLAIPDGAGIKPGPVVASAFPHEALGEYSDGSFAHFVPVARTVLPAAMPQYLAKFNFGQSAVLGITNDVSMCSGWRFICLPILDAITTMFTLKCWKSEDDRIWWAKIVSSDGSTRYRCVTRRTHGMLNVPATARWRWKKDDEGLWTRCAQGCCEVYGKN